MTAIKLVSWNMEWMNDLFATSEGPAAFRSDGGAVAPLSD